MKFSDSFRLPAIQLVIFLMQFIFQPVASQQVIYVGPNETYDNIGWGLAVANEGDTVIVRDGVYTQNIKVRKAVVLMAENKHQAILTGNDTIQARISIRQASVDGAVIDGFRFTAGDYAAINVGDMDATKFPENCIVRNNLIEDHPAGIVVSPYAMNTTITGNNITGSQGFAINDMGKGNVLISDNTLEDNGSGIFLSEEYDVTTTISGNTIRNNTDGPGIEVEKNNTTLEGNLIEGNLVGINSNCGHDGIIVRNNNQVINNIEQGIILDCGITGFIEDNIISGNGMEGIRIGGNVTVTGNEIHHNSGFGLWITNENGTVQENNIHANGSHGIEVAAEAVSVEILDNTITGNMQNGIVAWNEAYIKGNTISGNREHGIFLPGSATNVQITDQNIISDNLGCEIYLEEGSYALIRDNTIEDDTTDLNERICNSGILIKGSAQVKGNLIRHSNSAGIYVYETADEAVITARNTIDSCVYGVYARADAVINDNTISNNEIVGIVVGANGPGSTISFNKIEKNRYGVYFEGGSPDLSIMRNNISENVYGIDAAGEARVRNNTIRWNDSTGIIIEHADVDLGTALEADSGLNSILENGVWNVQNEIPDTIEAWNNFWGLTEASNIDATIYDDDEDELSGPVIFEPFLDTLNVGISRRTLPPEDRDQGLILEVFPNPAGERVTVSFALKESQQVSLKVYDVNGRLAASVITNQYYPRGKYQVTWNCVTPEGKAIPEGLYFLVLATENMTDVSRLVRLQ